MLKRITRELRPASARKENQIQMFQIIRSDWECKQFVEVFHSEQEYVSCVAALECQATNDCANGSGDGSIDPAWYNPIVIGEIRETRSPIGKWHDYRDYFEPREPKPGLEAEFMAAHPGVEIGFGFWYGGYDWNMASVAFRNTDGHMAYLDNWYNSLEDFLQNKRRSF